MKRELSEHERGVRLMSRAFRVLDVPRHVCRRCALAVLNHPEAPTLMREGLHLVGSDLTENRELRTENTMNTTRRDRAARRRRTERTEWTTEESVPSVKSVDGSGVEA